MIRVVFRDENPPKRNENHIKNKHMRDINTVLSTSARLHCLLHIYANTPVVCKRSENNPSINTRGKVLTKIQPFFH